MPRHRVILGGGSLNMGGLSANMQWQSSVIETDTEAEAVAAARAECRAEFDPEGRYNRLVRVDVVHDWAITVKGRHDARKRETFIVKAVRSETEALRYLTYNRAATRFANLFTAKQRAANVVKVECLS